MLIPYPSASTAPLAVAGPPGPQRSSVVGAQPHARLVATHGDHRNQRVGLTSPMSWGSHPLEGTSLRENQGSHADMLKVDLKESSIFRDK